MPSVDVSMARSLRGGIWGSVMGSIHSSVQSRDVISDAQNNVNDFKTAISSWDNCMSVNFCKWPVIAIIVVGGLIVFSIVWCIARCACCGMSCCCQCCYCLKCCGNCCGMCDTPRGTPHKYLDEPYVPKSQGYKSQAPMHAAAIPPTPFAPAAVASPPQYAEFDVSKRSAPADADALPPMPSWDGAGSKKVPLEGEAMELEQLKKPEAGPSSQNVPLMAGATSGSVSPLPTDPYGQPSNAVSSGYLAPSARDPYAASSQGYGGYSDAGYGQSQTSLVADQGYGAGAGVGAGAAAMALGPGRRSPHDDYNNGYGQNQGGRGYPQSRSQPDYNTGYEQGGYGMGGSGQRRSPPRSGPSSNAAGGYRRSPAPPADYGYEQRDQYSNRGYDRQYPQSQQRKYSSESSRPLASRGGSERQYANQEASPNLQNNSGFDFQSGFSRPEQYNYNRGPSAPHEQQPLQSNGEGYPGYKSYQPAQQGWSGV